jgi:hypothetical protein
MTVRVTVVLRWKVWFSRRHREEILRCSFCKQTQNQVAKLISSPPAFERAYICDECVRVCLNAIEDAPGPSGRVGGEFVSHAAIGV